MGGKVFDEYGLSTPRMPPLIYERVLEEAKTKLRQLYPYVDNPIEGPAKKDHGDVDIIVATDDNGEPAENEVVAALLGAHRFKQTPQSRTTHFAIPWPHAIESTTELLAPADGHHSSATDELAEDIGEEHHVLPVKENNEALPNQKHIQIDVDVAISPRNFRWIVFHHAHSDLWNILATIINPFGLTATTDGFHIRIPDVEHANKKFARVKLSDDPEQILDYLSLDKNKYRKPFDSRDDLLDYCTSCRFFKAPTKDYTITRHQLKSNDRQRLTKRPLFAYWIQSYFPRQRGRPPGSSAHLSRNEAIEDALSYFGLEARHRYDEQKRDWFIQHEQQNLWTEIKISLPVSGLRLGFAMRGLRDEIIGCGKDGEIIGPTDVQIAYVTGDFKKVKFYALNNWEQAAKKYETDVVKKNLDQLDLSEVRHLVPNNIGHKKEYTTKENKCIC